MLTEDEVRIVAAELEKDARPEWARLGRLTRYARGRQKDPWLPDSAETEYREIAKKSASNWLDLVIRATSQGLIVDGYMSASDESTVWVDGWQANSMDSRQHPLHRAALIHGYAFVLVMPSDEGVWVRPDAATSVFARYSNPDDEWPLVALRCVTKDRWELWDSTHRYVLDGKPGSGRGQFVSVEEHHIGVCPVTKIQAQYDLLGDPVGEIEPVLAIQDRIVDATFNLQMVAKYGAWPQRWIAGMAPPEIDSDGNPIGPRVKAYVDSILVGDDPDTKFGQFAAADLSKFVEALEAHIRHLAAITQTPPHYLLGSMVNLSAEALAAAESGLQRKIRERREVMGEGHEQALRLVAHLLGDDVAAKDPAAQVHWQDVESRSLAQTSDALLKLAQLGVPKQKLFQMIPGWTQADAEEAAAMAAEPDPMDLLVQQLEDGMASVE